MKQRLALLVLAFVAAGCGQNNSLFIDEPLAEDLPTSLAQIHKRVASRANKVSISALLEQKSSGSNSDGRGAGRGAVASNVTTLPNIDLRPVCALPVAMDIYIPASALRAGGAHTMMLVHGGGWIGGTRDLMNGIAAQFVGKSWIVANITYPLGVPMEQIFGGVACAAAWLRSTSSNGLIHPEKISALGGSAGGHLVGLLAALGNRAGASRVQTAVSFVGPANLEGLWQAVPMLRQALETVLGGPPTNNAKYAQFSPISYLGQGDSSTSIWLGGVTDPIVPLNFGSNAAYAADPRTVTLKNFSGGHDMPQAELDYVLNTWLPAISPQ